jgi:aspartyl-tRNA(Asn)/glutamyl-tRNA(Gln) amidotransferase subunit B
MENTYKGYTPTIGIEVHAELKTKTKMFCRSRNDPHGGNPNSYVCPVCMGHPGTLPVVNKEAVLHVLRVGKAVQGELADYTEFDRKNYFYPDIPKGYQISQYEYPLVKGGELNGVKLTRVHLEEDTARSQHDQGDGSIVDYNRAGVPLMELVTEPVIHDARTAGAFARELQLLLRTLGVSDAHMEKGGMRVEANISVSKTDTFGTKVEVKNLNSFKSVEGAIQYEVKRQVELLERGEQVVQETRGWDENKSKTFSQRIKESADDYRYFPEPDIPKFKLSLLTLLDDKTNFLPSEKRILYTNLGLPREQIEFIISNTGIDTFYKSVLEQSDDTQIRKLAANYLVTDIAALDEVLRIDTGSVTCFVELINMLHEGSVTSRVAKDIIREVVFDHIDPRKLVEERGVSVSNDDSFLAEVVEKVIAENESVALEFKGGKSASIQFLVGQGMKASRGSINPEKLKEALVRTIEKS